MIPLPDAFLNRPLAHRALHDTARGRPENSRAAIAAAIARGYGVEIDIQLSSDGVAMVFHDDTLDRLSARTGPVRDQSAARLSDISLCGTGETIPTLTAVLDLVAGRVPILIEMKAQSGDHGLGPHGAPAMAGAVARALERYRGDVAVMSFNPHQVAEFARIAPDRPRGLTTCAFDQADWPNLEPARRTHLRAITDFAETGSGFISHDRRDLDAAPVARLKQQGVPVLCWTVRSPAQERTARQVADNITFEQYLPARPDP